MKNNTLPLGVLALALSLAVGGTSRATEPSARCTDLTRFKASEAKLVITKAQEVAASGSVPSYCRVDGMIDQRTGADGRTYGIGFAVALPDDWNERFLFQGGGGYNGSVRAPVGGAAAGDKSALARGFAVASTDSGHKGKTFDTSFNVDQQASLDFAQVAVARVTQLSKEIISGYYGESPKYSYFTGCSTGGREAMLMTQRYPSFFDGVVSGDPAMRTGFSRLGNNWRSAAFAEAAPKNAEGQREPYKLFSESDKKLLAKGLLKACDAADGIEDGMVFNTRACTFDPAVLTCKGSKDATCLSSTQVDALKRAFAGPRDSKGDVIYKMSMNDADLASFLPKPPPEGARALASPAPTALDVDQRLFAILNDPLEALTDSTWTNLSSFSGHGGKLLFYHGMADPTFSAMDTLDYYERMAEANGGMEKVENWSRLFLVPGMLHCRGGDSALDQFDLLTAVVNWVEKGIAPESVAATGKAFPGRSRPLCAYPKYAQYSGHGDSQDANNFICEE